MLLAVLLLGQLAVLQLTAAYPQKPTVNGLQEFSKRDVDESVVGIRYEDTGEEECHPIGIAMHLYTLWHIFLCIWVFRSWPVIMLNKGNIAKILQFSIEHLYGS